ncbi:uncharacterized protein LOC117192689 isoform X2 [Drosophila miranda]|uniref:uncharacterized protein LOC117192689 isoform X2 n=1 Tax=Drosophila miranda TaxID=7229 RepID=UPI00143FAAF2|nr:uncharacterized protein LOC117192689 isoform X2 [Drosophila miranda]
MAKRFLSICGSFVVLLLLQCIWATPQRTAAYSLQAAVDELHRREESKFPLNAPPPLDDWEEDAPAPSVFRERENQSPLSGEPAHNELADQLLREIEEAGEQDRSKRYKDAVRQWWHHFDQRQQLGKDVQPQQHQQEQDTDPELFEQKKRMRVPPYYLLMQKKRSYPVLPWLPYNANADKKKRFPVAKRAIGSNKEQMPLAKTDERVAQELSELFGKPVDSHLKPLQEQSDEKKKRSADEPNTTTAAHVPEMPPATTTALGDMRLEINFQRVNVTNEKPAAPAGEMIQHGGHAGHHGNHIPGMSPEYRHRKRSDHAHRRDSDEHDHDVDEHDDEGEESSDEDDHDEFDEDESDAEPDTEAEAYERRRKKKRAAVSGAGHSKHLRAPTVGHLMLRAKKSIDWSQYFGLDLDRKKKSAQETANEEAFRK